MVFDPKYTITPKLLANIKRIATLTVEQNSRPLPQLVLIELERRAFSLSAYSSTCIEGNPLPLTEVKRLLGSIPKNLRDSEREVVNYNETLTWLSRLLNKKTPLLSLALILRIHKAIMKGLLNLFHCGRLRAEPVFVNSPRTGEILFLPPDHQEVKPLLTELLAYLTLQQETLDPLILAGIFHKQFVMIHPFLDGNGRTARLATKVILARCGINTFPLFSFENFYNQNVSRYFKEVGERGNYYELRSSIDFTSWLEYFTEGIIDEILRVSGEITQAVSSPQQRLQPHHLQILKFIKAHGFIMDSDYAKMTKRAKATRNLDFNRLMAWGLIKRHGQGKHTHYKLKE